MGAILVALLATTMATPAAAEGPNDDPTPGTSTGAPADPTDNPGQPSDDTSEPAPAPGDDQDMRHYVGDSDTSGSVADQCATPVDDRAGAWFCPQEGVHATAASCSVIGCWNYNANYWAEFEGNGVYGYGGTVIGEVVFYAEDKFSGGSSTTKPFQIETSRAMKSVKASGERLYFSTAHPEGNPVNGGNTYKVWSGGLQSAAHLVSCFGGTGYTAYENTVAHAGIAHQWQWTDTSSNYPGTWWAWVKSPKFHRNSSGAYILNNPPQMGTSWYGSGWTR